MNEISKELFELKEKFIISATEGEVISSLVKLTSKGIKVIINEKKEIFDVLIPSKMENKEELIKEAMQTYSNLKKLERWMEVVRCANVKTLKKD